MPGLVGFAGLESSRSEREELLQGMRDAITHRAFYALDPLFLDDRVCATRAHLGLVQRAVQPLSCAGRHVWFDGEFTNQHELRQRLPGVAESDPAILLGLLRECSERHDFSLLAKIDGIFAAVVYDELEGRLDLVSDRYGFRHLFYRADDKGICWSSEQKVFALWPGCDAQIDPTAAEQFLATGSLSGERSWFEDVHLLAPGTVLSFDIAGRRRRAQRYWSWDSIRPALGPFDEAELCEEIARRLRAAVHQRAGVGERVGLRLGGSLESRAILAALPERVTPLHVVSEGEAGCDDLRIAARAAKLRHAQHHVFETRREAWIEARLDAVWWTDGQLNLLRARDPAVLEQERSLYDFGLSGLLGDVIAGGAFLAQPDASETELIGERGRRSLIQDSRLSLVFLEQRLPFMANELLELLISLPAELRADARLYHRVLRSSFPSQFRGLPWPATGLPTSVSGLGLRPASLVRGFRRRSRRALGQLGLRWSDPSQAADPSRWIRQRGSREIVEQLLLTRDAALFEWCGRDEVEGLWRSHLAGEDHAERLGRLLTLEIWAGQLAGRVQRPADGAG